MLENKGFQKARWTIYPMSPRLLTLRKAAKYLGLTEWALRERIWVGHIPYFEFPSGRKISINVGDLDGIVQKNNRFFI
jgi:hypothetical protein